MPAEEGNLISSDASLIRAVSNGDAETVRTLLAEGAYVDQKGRGGQTALMVAAIFCHVDIARLLLAAGADVRLKDNLGLTARAWAARRGSAEVAELLSNDSPNEELPSEKAEASSESLEAKTDRGKNAVKGNTSLQQLALRMTRGRRGTKAGPQRRELEDIATSLPQPGVGRDNPPEVEDAISSTNKAPRSQVKDSRPASEPDTKSPPEPDTVRFMKFHKQIMAAQQRRQAEQERLSAEREQRKTDDAASSVSELRVESVLQEGTPLGVVDATESSIIPARREIEESPPASPIETNTARPQDAPFLSEQEGVATWSPIDSTPSSEQEPPSSTDAALLSEPGAVASWSPTDATLLSEREVSSESAILSEWEAIASTFSTDATLLSEQGAVATWSSTDAPPLSEPEPAATPPSSDASLLSAPEAVATPSSTEAASRQAEVPRPTAEQLAGIATTIEHLRILEESRQLVESKIPAKFAGPKAAAVELDRHDTSTTLPRLRAELFTPIATLEPKPNPLLTPPPSKHCPKCNASYGDPLLAYCAFDATRLISADDPLPSQPAPDDRLSPTLWALVAVVGVLGAFLGYLIIDYRSTENLPSAPAAQIEPEIARKDLPVVGGDLSGMEVNVPEPEYPAEARTEGVSGTVTIRVQVNQKGRVILARSSGGDWRLQAAAVAAAQKATFSPEKLAVHGKVVSGTITYNFIAQTESEAATGLPVPAQTNSPPANEASSTTEPSEANAGGDYPIVGGPLFGAESNLPQADYPETARSKGIDGTITVTVRVNRAGKVISWRTSKGDSQLRAAALKAAKKATFAPEKLPGTGEVVGTITYNFKR